MKTAILILTTAYPWNGQKGAAFCLKNLYEKIVEISDYTITVLAADSPLIAQKNIRSIENKITIQRYQYWIKRYQALAYGDGILFNLKENPLLVFQVIPFVLSLFLHTIIEVIRNRPVLIHAHWILPTGLIAVIVGKLFRIPVMITAHGSDIYGLRSAPMRLLTRSTCRCASIINTVSASLKQEIFKINGNKSFKFDIWVQSMGIDENTFRYIEHAKGKLGLATDKKIILFVGRLCKVKGVEYLIKSIPHIKKSVTAFHVLIVGTGNLEKYLKDMSRAFERYITFAGQISNNDLPLYYSAADVVVVPSVETAIAKEGLPLVILEALSCRARIVATSIGGIVDLKNFGSLCLVPPGDEKALTKGILDSLSDSPRRPEENVTEFAISTVAERFSQKYKEIIAK